MNSGLMQPSKQQNNVHFSCGRNEATLNAISFAIDTIASTDNLRSDFVVVALRKSLRLATFSRKAD